MRHCLLRIPFLLIVLLGLIFSSCEKEEIIIDDNTAPPDHTVPTLVLETYINKCYISLLGRKPSTQEESAAMTTLNAGNLSVASRKTMLVPVLQSSEYRKKLLETQSIRLLTLPLDTAEIRQFIVIYSNLLTQPEYAQFVTLIEAEIARMQVLYDTPAAVQSGNLSMRQLQKRLVSNFMYDELNMGSFNLVVSLYNHFLFRYPTSEEIQAGINMVDGLTSVAFYTNGASKDDFITIFFDSNDYHEGAVRELFLRYLFREPTPEELNQHTVVYKASDNYEELQKRILSLDEFAGL